MVTLPDVSVVVEYPTLVVKSGCDEQRSLFLYLHEYSERDEQGRRSFTCYVTDRPVHLLTEAPAVGYGETPEAAYEDALKDYGFDELMALISA